MVTKHLSCQLIQFNPWACFITTMWLLDGTWEKRVWPHYFFSEIPFRASPLIHCVCKITQPLLLSKPVYTVLKDKNKLSCATTSVYMIKAVEIIVLCQCLGYFAHVVHVQEQKKKSSYRMQRSETADTAHIGNEEICCEGQTERVRAFWIFAPNIDLQGQDDFPSECKWLLLPLLFPLGYIKFISYILQIRIC